MLAHLKTQETRQDPDERRSWKVRLIKGLYDRGLGAMDVRRLFRFIDWMMDLPKGLEKLVLQEVQQFEEEKHMPFITSAERLGREEGLREMCLESIELMLRGKFGDEGAQLLPEIRQIEDLELLRTIHRAIMPAASLEEVRRLWP